MDKLRILVTGCGCPGIEGTLYSLRNNFDNRPVHIIGVDADPFNAGKYLCDEFAVSVPATNQDYINVMLGFDSVFSPDVIIPHNTAELEILASNSGFFRGKVLVNRYTTILLANNKGKLTEYSLANTKESLKIAVEEFGWPDKRVVVKPPVSNGMRGFRIIDEHFDRKNSFYKDKPDNTIVTFKQLKKILGDEFPELMVCEYLPGKEYSVDCLRVGDRIDVIPRERTKIRSGITFAGRLVNNPYIINECKAVAKRFNLTGCFGFQLKEDSNYVPRFLECNPRVQGTMVMSTLAGANVIYGAVKDVLGEKIPAFDIDWNTEFYRYWGGVTTKRVKI